MTTNVPTDGFANLNAPAAPPKDAAPGFVVPPLDAPAGTPPVVPVATPAQNTDALAAAVAALTAAMTPTAGAAVPVDTGGTGPGPDGQSLNTLDPKVLEDPNLRSMAEAFKMLGAGLDFDRVFAKALDSGDPSLLDIAYLKEKGGANVAGLQGLAESIIRMVNSKAEQSQAEVHALAGSKENWEAATTAFNAKAPQEFKLAVQQMFNSGKSAHITAAAKLVVQFAKGQGYVPTPAGLLSTGAGSPSGQALSKTAFQVELRKLNSQDPDYTDKRNELFSRRAMGKQLGQ